MTGAEVPDDGRRKLDLSQGLATWLEGLGLAGHLADAGLPTFVRDEHGWARWTDPGTGEPLTLDQLEQLDDLLHQEGSEREHAVPVTLVLVAREVRLREQLMATPWHDYESLAGLRGTSVDATRFAVVKARNDHRLLVVPAGEQGVVPAFQLTAGGELRPDLEPVLPPLLAAGIDPWRVWGWLTQPAGLLGGEVPERAVTDPGLADLVPLAAVRLAQRAVEG